MATTGPATQQQSAEYQEALPTEEKPRQSFGRRVRIASASPSQEQRSTDAESDAGKQKKRGPTSLEYMLERSKTDDDDDLVEERGTFNEE